MSEPHRPATEVLVTGAAGFLGRLLLQRLREPSGPPTVGIHRRDTDLADANQVQACFERYRPRRVVHLAASLARGCDRTARLAQWRDTFTAGRNVIEAAVDHGVEHLIMAGSVDELGDREGILGPELPPAPLTDYGLCKSLLLETAGFHARRSPVRVHWFRPFTVYGPGQTGPMLVPSAFAAAAAGRPQDFTDGSQERDFIYIDDLMGWILAALAAPPVVTGDLTIHHVGTGTPTPVRTVLERIAALFPGAQFRLGALPRRPGEPQCQVAAAPGAAGPVPWRPQVGLEEGLAATAAWWRAGGS